MEAGGVVYLKPALWIPRSSLSFLSSKVVFLWMQRLSCDTLVEGTLLSTLQVIYRKCFVIEHAVSKLVLPLRPYASR